MKRGEITLEALVKLIPHIMITVLLIAIFTSLILIFMAKEKSPEEQDFQRILAEVDDLIDVDYLEPETIVVPVQSDSPLKLSFYPKTSKTLPVSCQKQTCICLIHTKKNKIVETCKIYSEIKGTCGTDKCGDICFSKTTTLAIKPDVTSVTITRGCHELTIT